MPVTLSFFSELHSITNNYEFQNATLPITKTVITKINTIIFTSYSGLGEAYVY